MILSLCEQGIVKEQKIELTDDVIIIYGYNNCGKTTILKLIDQCCDRTAIASLFASESYGLSMYIPTNRVIVSTALMGDRAFSDAEEIINYKRGMYDKYDEHLKMIRDYFLKYDVVRDFVKSAVNRMFGVDTFSFEQKSSDGIENIINIYVNIIWILAWNENLSEMQKDAFERLLITNSAYILIDEIEMFLHVSVQSKLISSLKQDFPKCQFVFSTHSPLLLTRYKKSKVFQMENGILNSVVDDFYFKDLDNIYESCFQVKELPEEIRAEINYLGEIVLGEEKVDTEKVESIIEKLAVNYPNLYKKYNKLVVKAKDKANI